MVGGKGRGLEGEVMVGGKGRGLGGGDGGREGQRIRGG